MAIDELPLVMHINPLSWDNYVVSRKKIAKMCFPHQKECFHSTGIRWKFLINQLLQSERSPINGAQSSHGLLGIPKMKWLNGNVTLCVFLMWFTHHVWHSPTVNSMLVCHIPFETHPTHSIFFQMSRIDHFSWKLYMFLVLHTRKWDILKSRQKMSISFFSPPVSENKWKTNHEIERIHHGVWSS